MKSRMQVEDEYFLSKFATMPYRFSDRLINYHKFSCHEKLIENSSFCKHCVLEAFKCTFELVWAEIEVLESQVKFRSLRIPSRKRFPDLMYTPGGRIPTVWCRMNDLACAVDKYAKKLECLVANHDQLLNFVLDHPYCKSDN